MLAVTNKALDLLTSEGEIRMLWVGCGCGEEIIALCTYFGKACIPFKVYAFDQDKSVCERCKVKKEQ
jgi:chemotaxis methyl-accepting protein methylase